MHRHVVTATSTTSARDCARLIAQKHVGCLIITDDNRPVGIITERSFVDLLLLGTINPDSVVAKEFMSSPLITIGSHATFSKAMEVFNNKGIRRLPVVHHGKITGLLTLKNMIIFSNLALTSLTRQHIELKERMERDGLTGVYTKEAITNILQREYERIRRYGGRSSILFIDIDHFKLINDTYSHLAGDVVLAKLGTIFQKVCRQIDFIGRVGGEEFIIIAPNRKKIHAVQFGERLRKTIETTGFKYQGKTISVTISIGIASLFQGRDYTRALERADQALYYAKKKGRNRIGLLLDNKLTIASIQEKQ